MDKEKLQRHFDKLNGYLTEYGNAKEQHTIDKCINYISKDSELNDYLFKNSGSGDPKYYYLEFISSKYFEIELKRAADALKKDIDKEE